MTFNLYDRHNGNILIRDTGHLVHIDFGFMLSNSPGSLNFENGAFKLTAEYVQLIGGKDTAMWHYFKVPLHLI
jgi:phosphatidylinositol 4-kinase